VSALRTLPSHVGPLKLQIQWVDHEGNEVVEREDVLGELGDDMYNPRVSYHKRVSNREIPGSTVLLVRVIGLSTLDYKPGVLGFAYFHLGFDSEGNFLERDIPEYLMISGHFQIPLYYGAAQGYLTAE
jgi:hypothetical protein